MAKNPYEKSVDAQLVEPHVRTPKIPNGDNQAPSRRGKKGHTIYLDLDAHYVLKELALQHDKKSAHLLIEGVNLMFQHYGKKPIA